MAEAEILKFNNASFEIADKFAREQLNNIANEIGVDEQNNFVELNTTNKTIIGAINEVFQNASNGKKLIANAITGKGITATESDTFAQLAEKISQISSATIYSIINNLTNAINSNDAITIEENTPYSANISASTGYKITSVTITMDNTDITSTAYSNGVISIDSVTGDIVIIVTTEVDTDTIVGTVDSSNNITLTGLSTGTYVLKYEDINGNVLSDYDNIANVEVV